MILAGSWQDTLGHKTKVIHNLFYFIECLVFLYGLVKVRYPITTSAKCWSRLKTRTYDATSPQWDTTHFIRVHSVESPSMVDPQWDIWYLGSKWNLHTVCWSVVGCEWGTTSVYFGITYVCFVPSRLPVFAIEPQYLLQDFSFLSKVPFEGHIQNLQKFPVGLKFEWGL